MKHLFFISLVSAGILVPDAHAAMRQYGAHIDNANWQMKERDRLQCDLKHQIPRYGSVNFQTVASKELNLSFEMQMRRLPATYDSAKVYATAPQWLPGHGQRLLGEMALKKQFNPGLSQALAWEVLTELEKGMQTTFFYQDWDNTEDQLAVSLSSVNFRPAYDEFMDCVSGLLPYSFDDISYTVLSYEKNSDQLTKASKRRLEMIGEYLKYDSGLELVLVNAFTDSYGGRWPNLQLSKRRAEAIKSYFVEQGVDVDRISAQGHGERRHIAPNNTVIEREKNRRVVIRMSKA